MRRFTIVSVVVMLVFLPGCLDYHYVSVHEVENPTWAYEMTQIYDLNSMGYSGEGVVVAIIDSGIDMNHPELKNARIIAWKDLINGLTTPYDDEGHGTAVAGVLCADGRLQGGAKNVSLIVVKAIDEYGSGKDSDVAEAVRFALDPNGDGDYRDGADIISLSLGGGRIPILGTKTEKAVKEAISWGTFVVAAADNDGEDDDGDVASPGSVKGVIAVGAISENGTIASFSSMGDNDGNIIPPRAPRFDPNKKPEVVSPGVNISVLALNGEYSVESGTSISTAFVTCVLALILQAEPQYQMEYNDGETTIYLLKEKIMETAMKLDGQEIPHDDHYGYGLIRGYDLVMSLKEG